MDPILFARLALLSAVLAISSPNGVPPAAGNTLYVVQSGDTLFSIALKFNTTIDLIQQANGLSDPNTLTLGQRLRIPTTTVVPLSTSTPPGPTPTQPPNSAIYIVKAGDTLATIAQKFGITTAAIQQANGITDANVLAVGQTLIIPGVAASPSPTPLPGGVTLVPPLAKQGNTLEIKITASDVTTATGKFGKQALDFISDSNTLYALVGMPRCGGLGDFPVALTTTDSQGNSKPVNFTVHVNPTNYPIENLTLTTQMASLLDPALVNSENARVQNVVTPFTPVRQWADEFSNPLRINDWVVTTAFGTRRSYNGGAAAACGHEGQDFGNSKGASVYAPAAGTVVLAEPLKVRGNVVFIDHGLGVYSGFYHLSKIIAKPGQVVKEGDLIGVVGTTGFSTGDHLHWSLWVNGVYVDPIEWTRRTIP